MASRTICDKARMPSIRDVEVVLVVGLIELTVAVETGGQAGISERLVQREKTWIRRRAVSVGFEEGNMLCWQC